MTNYKPRLNLIFAIIAASLFTSACANKNETRQEDVDRYKVVESQLIDDAAAEQRRRKSEIRVAERLRQLEVERSKVERELNEATQLAKAEIRKSNNLGDDELLRLSDTPPIVTNVVVANSSDENEPPLWALKDYPSPVDGLPICAVVSQPRKVTNGSLDTNVTVIVGADTIYLRTDATFDPNGPETGFRIDAGFPILFDSYHNELTAVVDNGYSRLRNALDSGSTLIVAFAYSPQLSTAESHILELSLDSIGEPLTQLANCDAPVERLANEFSADRSRSNDSPDL